MTYKGIDPLFAPKDDGKTWADIIPELVPWKCCGCGAPSPDRKRSCECATVCLYRDGQPDQIALKRNVQTYDSRCYDLAETFLEDEPHLNTERRRKDLAATIQGAIEGWIETERSNYEPPDPPGWEGGFAENH